MGEHDFEAQLDVIAELCVDPPSNDVRDCLRLYDPRHNTRQLKVDLNKCPKQNIVSTLDYLGINDSDQYTKPACITMLICRIQNLFPDKCNICEETYCIKLGETPLLVCEICGQGSHNKCILEKLNIPMSNWDCCSSDQVLQMCNPTNMPGFHYLCGPCTTSTIPSKDMGLLKRKLTTATDQNLDVSMSLTQMVGSPNPDKSVINKQDVDSQSIAGDGNTSEHGEDNQTPSQLDTRICPFYRKGICRYGSSGKKCPNQHPKPCKNLIKHGTKGQYGCKLGRQKCKFFHPKMCPTSISKGECYNADCKLRHVAGTKRHKQTTTTNAMNPKKKKVPTATLR